MEDTVHARCDSRLVGEVERARDRVYEATGVRPSRSQIVRAAIERGLRSLLTEESER